jgi:hypothetical protein
MGSGGELAIYEDGGSIEEEDNNKSNKAKVEIAECVEPGSSGFFMFSPSNDCAGTIDSMIGGGAGPINPQSSCGNGNKDNDNNNAQREACIGRDGLSLISYDCKCLVYFSKGGGDTIVACFESVIGFSLEKEAN